MQPLPTEAGPRTVCAHCGEPVPPPNGSATFVYGVGPVGYQSCASCGAKWRYLWQDRPPVRVKPDRGRRLFFVLGALVLIALLIVGGVALARSKRWRGGDSSSRSAPPSTTPATSSTAPGTVAPPDLNAAADYLEVADPMHVNRTNFLAWLVDQAPATSQLVVNQTTDVYIATARGELARLEQGHWPASAAEDVATLVRVDGTFVDDLDSIKLGQQGTLSYITMLQSEASAVVDADNAVRSKLGLPSVHE